MSNELKKVESGGRMLRHETPPVDVLENADGFLLRTDLPGVVEDDVMLELENGVLTLVAKRPVGEDHVRYGRRFQIPRDTDPEKVSANFERGVLHVTIPKAEAAKPRRISVSVS